MTFKISISSKRNQMFMWKSDEDFFQIFRNAIMTEWCCSRFWFCLYNSEFLIADSMQTRCRFFAIRSWLDIVMHFRKFRWIFIDFIFNIYRMNDLNRYIVNLYYVHIYSKRRRDTLKVITKTENSSEFAEMFIDLNFAKMFDSERNDAKH